MSGHSTFALVLRFMGDIAHVVSMIILTRKILKTRSISGLSYKTQLLKLIIFITRYLDLFSFSYKKKFHFYLTAMKLAYLAFQAGVVYIIRFKLFDSYEPTLDDFKIEFLIIPSFVISLILSFKNPTPQEVLYYFSIVLEAIAILPQLIQLQKMQESESLTSQYIVSLGLYRLFYTISWIYKKIFAMNVEDVLIAAGLIQTAMYMHFFFLYYGYIFKGRGIKRIPK